MQHYEIRKRCILGMTVNNHKHAKRNCEVLKFSKVKHIREVPGYRLRCHILVLRTLFSSATQRPTYQILYSILYYIHYSAQKLS